MAWSSAVSHLELGDNINWETRKSLTVIMNMRKGQKSHNLSPYSAFYPHGGLEQSCVASCIGFIQSPGSRCKFSLLIVVFFYISFENLVVHLNIVNITSWWLFAFSLHLLKIYCEMLRLRLIPLLQKHNRQTKHTANLSGFISSPPFELHAHYKIKIFLPDLCKRKRQMSSVVLLSNIIR